MTVGNGIILCPIHTWNKTDSLMLTLQCFAPLMLLRGTYNSFTYPKSQSMTSCSWVQMSNLGHRPLSRNSSVPYEDWCVFLMCYIFLFCSGAFLQLWLMLYWEKNTFLIRNTLWTLQNYKLLAPKLWDFFFRKFNLERKHFQYKRRNMTGNYKEKFGIFGKKETRPRAERMQFYCALSSRWFFFYLLLFAASHLSCYRLFIIFSFKKTVRSVIINSYLFQSCWTILKSFG